jgi:hypothetical protein
LNEIMQAQGGALIGQLARNFGVDDKQAGSALSQLVPALAAGMKKNVGQTGGLESLLGALQSGNHQRYIDDASRMTDSGTIEDGNNILGHLFGSKDVSRQVAAKASAQTGIDDGILKKMLPVVATMVMGSLSKQSSSGGALAGLLGGSKSGGGQSLLTSFLDADGDGSVADDLLNMFMKR